MKTATIFIQLFVVSTFLAFSNSFNSAKLTNEWVIRTDPYKSHIYPGESGLNYFLKYNYGREAKTIRKYLNKEYDVQRSPGIEKIYKEVSSGAFFDRKIYFNFDFLKRSDTVVVKVFYENGDSTSQKIFNVDDITGLEVDLTKYKSQHDFSTGQHKNNSYKGLVKRVDIFVRPRGNWHDKSSVRVVSKIITTANMPGLVNRLNGARILKRN